VTCSAALAIASLNHAVYQSDREIFKAHKRFRKLPVGFNRIEPLRYVGLKREKLFHTLLDFYVKVVDFCREEGIKFAVDNQRLRNETVG